MSKETNSTVGVSVGTQVTVQTLLEAGAHFGHQTHRWNPKMLPFIFGERNGIHIINLDASVSFWDRARKMLLDVTRKGGTALIVGTKQQIRDIVREEAVRSGAFYVTDRWLGGTLSNFSTIRAAIERMKKIEDLLAQAEQENSKVRLVKKERVTLKKELDKLQASLGGIRDMRRLPDVVFVTDVVKEEIAVAECQRLQIPVIGLVDTNADPEVVNMPIPCNDDAPKVQRLVLSAVADTIIEGRRAYEVAMQSSNPEGGRGGRGRQRVVESTEGATTEATAG